MIKSPPERPYVRPLIVIKKYKKAIHKNTSYFVPEKSKITASHCENEFNNSYKIPYFAQMTKND